MDLIEILAFGRKTPFVLSLSEKPAEFYKSLLLLNHIGCNEGFGKWWESKKSSDLKYELYDSDIMK